MEVFSPPLNQYIVQQHVYSDSGNTKHQKRKYIIKPEDDHGHGRNVVLKT